MLSSSYIKVYPSAKRLVADKAASRIHAKDASLFDFDADAAEVASEFMGWVDLASSPQVDLKELHEFSHQVKVEGLDQVLLIGEGGSTQAPMTITKYNKTDCGDVKFKVLDSVSPTRVRSILNSMDLMKTLVLVSSKSGGTLETLSVLSVVAEAMNHAMPESEVPDHLVAITDPESPLATHAEEEKWRHVFYGEPTVGGRFSALSVFGLVPAALVGLDVERFLEKAAEIEKVCSSDSLDNPAILLAGFLYDNARAGRDKVCFLSPKRGRVFGLWIEQLLAESLGKRGRGILPNIEPDPLDLREDRQDRVLMVCRTASDDWDEVRSFETGLSVISPDIPVIDFAVDDVYELGGDFLVLEYAVAMCGYLMGICPFDQPDVASAKAKTLDVLSGGEVPEAHACMTLMGLDIGDIEVRVSPRVCDEPAGADDDCVRRALAELLSSLGAGDFFAINAFVPFSGEGRREALDSMRRAVAYRLGNVTCLEIGPRYLHSTGQLQKGGTDNGVFLILSTGEAKDIELPAGSKAPSLGALAKAQAIGDYAIFMERGRRAAHIHLPDNSATTLRLFAEVFEQAVEEVSARRLQAIKTLDIAAS